MKVLVDQLRGLVESEDEWSHWAVPGAGMKELTDLILALANKFRLGRKDYYSGRDPKGNHSISVKGVPAKKVGQFLNQFLKNYDPEDY